MAKLTKNQLKDIVKECLVEILEEGLSNSMGSSHLIESSRSTPKNNKSTSRAKRQPQRKLHRHLDSVSYNQEAPQNDRFEESISNTVQNLTSDPIMASIFSDTARTTLQEMSSAESSGQGRPSQMESVAPGKDISDIDIFSGASQNWAALAFADKPESK